VQCLRDATNPIIYHGLPLREARISLGERFRIGGTLFRIRDTRNPTGRDRLSPDDSDFSTTRVALGISDPRVGLVARYAQSLWLARTSLELATQLSGILAELLPHAETVAVLEGPPPGTDAGTSPDYRLLSADSCRGAQRATVSPSSIRSALRTHRSVVRLRTPDGNESGPGSSGRWSCCVPMVARDLPPWCLYASGGYGPGLPLPAGLSPDDLAGDVQHLELLAVLGSAVRQVKMLEDRFAGVRQFFSPSVVETVLQSGSESSLAPTERETVVLFCDLRGYSRIVERSRDDLKGLLDRVGQALGVMTDSIIDEHGAIADFQGDAALGFWGWPLPLDAGPLPACRAALRILRTFSEANAVECRSRLTGFRTGLGIACGTAIAGRIGTRQQAKVGVFGPVVNLGARLESMTRQIGAGILMDGPTAEWVRRALPASEGRCRRVGLIRPAGVDQTVDVHELLPPENESTLRDQELKTFDSAADAFQRGDWDHALDLLGELPPRDRVRDFLQLQIASREYHPPDDWDGVIRLKSK